MIAGCAHNGIINIIDQFKADKGNPPDYVIGGFHLYNHGNKQNEAPGIVDELGRLLLETRAQYYTCHCTGIESYLRLKAVMGEKVIGVVSGKGGAGKSSVTFMFAVTMNRLGSKIAILDADITGPSIPKAFGIVNSVYIH